MLPGYLELEVGELDAARHEADLELVATALDEAPAAGRERLLDQLRQTPFLIGENAGTGESRLTCPGELYQRTRALEVYFGGNPAIWFAADAYGPWLAQLRGMGVRDSVRLRAREPDDLGYVAIADEFARHERGIAGFDPDASLDGLEYALGHPSPARSEFVWNVLLVPGRQLIAGVVESSPRLEFADGRRQAALSVIGTLATQAAWLPSADGTFMRPAELSLADLPPTFARDAVVAQALGMSQPAVDEASRQLGLPPDLLRRLSRHPDLVAQLERELDSRESGRRGPPPVLL